MPNSLFFIFLMFRALYRMICKSSKKIFGKKSLIVTNVNTGRIYVATTIDKFFLDSEDGLCIKNIRQIQWD